MGTKGAPSVATIDKIVAMDDEPVLRNLLITQGYHDLSQGIAELIGAGNATWATFGCWASKTAGRFVRGDEAPAFIRRAMRSSRTVAQQARRIRASLLDRLETEIEAPFKAVVDTAGQLVEDVSLYMAAGNKVVFAEIGGAFARFCEVFADRSFTEDRLEALLSEYPPGPAEPDKVIVDRKARRVTSIERGGASLLREMLQQYFLAAREPDGRRKAQIVLLGNAYGGIHEQTRLQPYIAGSIDEPVEDLLREFLHRRATEGETDPGRIQKIHAVVDLMAHPLGADLLHLWQVFATVELMELTLPDGVLHLGRDVPAPPGKPLFPPQLRTIQLPELRRLLEQYRALGAVTHGNRLVLMLERDIAKIVGDTAVEIVAHGSAARDWVVLAQRMRYILELFRSRQQDP